MINTSEMQNRLSAFLAATALLFIGNCPLSAEPASTYSTVDAVKHVGETATVCGKVAGSHRSGRGNMFLNLDGTYPTQPFTAFIPAASAATVGDAQAWEGKSVCVTGKIALYKGKAEIIVTSKSQIQEK
jgi:hypothetical protein